MTYEKPGQTLQLGAKTFTVGGLAWRLTEESRIRLVTVQAIVTDDPACYMAACDFGNAVRELLPVDSLEPIPVSVPKGAARLYALYYHFDGDDGQWAKTLGVSSDKNLLIRLMLEDIAADPEAVLTCADFIKEKDLLRFEFEDPGKEGAFYCRYHIEPEPVYTGTKGGVTL